jgi:hypothetical protein
MLLQDLKKKVLEQIVANDKITSQQDINDIEEAIDEALDKAYEMGARN